MQTLGFVLEVKRHVYYQPVTLGMALELTNQRQGALAQLDGQLYEQGSETLKLAVVNQGANQVLGSETAIVEVWASKTPSEQKKSRSAWPKHVFAKPQAQNLAAITPRGFGLHLEYHSTRRRIWSNALKKKA